MEVLLASLSKPEYALKSSLFDDWHLRRVDSIVRGVNAIKMQRPMEWASLIVNVLHLPTDQPKFLTHARGTGGPKTGPRPR